MSLEGYEGTAIDTSEFVDVQPVTDTTETEVVETADSTVTTEEITTEQPVVEKAITEFDIPGIGKMTIDEIKELKQSGLRQSDYTRKTQEAARQREENKNAIELFDYLRANPQLVEAMKAAEGNPNQVMLNNATPENEMLQKLAYNQKSMEIDMKLNSLKSQYNDVDEVALFKKASELGTEDLEFVYKALHYDSNTIDQSAIIAQAKEELRKELEANKAAVSTIVDTKQTAPVKVDVTLTADEKRIAGAMGLTDAEYKKWM